MRDGRQVTARLQEYKLIAHANKNDRADSDVYRGYYTYTAPDGDTYSIKRKFFFPPPDELTLYLRKNNFRKFYTEDDLDKAKPLFLLFDLAALLLYLFLMRLLFTG